jgi:hypothetical protein
MHFKSFGREADHDDQLDDAILPSFLARFPATTT